MKLVMSTVVAGAVLTLLATGLAEAQNKGYDAVRFECRSAVHHWGGMYRWYIRENRYNIDPIKAFNEVRECIKAAGYVPRLPPR
jgi:hypothetical protein